MHTANPFFTVLKSTFPTLAPHSPEWFELFFGHFVAINLLPVYHSFSCTVIGCRHSGFFRRGMLYDSYSEVALLRTGGKISLIRISTIFLSIVFSHLFKLLSLKALTSFIESGFMSIFYREINPGGNTAVFNHLINFPDNLPRST